jgi:hypothetical protein
MRKQTASQTQKHRTASPRKQPGLTARGMTSSQSATTECALDDRSHRTLFVVLRYSRTDVRDVTCSAPMRVRSVRISSCTPSVKA